MQRRRPGQSTEQIPKLKQSPVKKKAALAEKNSKSTKSWKSFLISLLVIIFVLYGVIPISVYLCPAVRRHAVFLNYVSLSRQKNLSQPIESGLVCTRNFYIPSEQDIKLGVWHVPPQSIHSKCRDNTIPIADEFNDPRPIFIYLHGNAGTRSGGHRVELYKILSQKLDAHVLAFDYRGFGDSSNVSPTEGGVVQDTNHVYNWLEKRVNSSRIFIWGHSLGTGVGVAFLHRLSKSDSAPAALILEAPFTKILDAAKHHPLSIFHRYMPFFDTLIAQPIGDKDTGFDSISRIGQITSPILILHAEDDGFIPFDHGKRLYEEALVSRKSGKPHETQFVGFDGKFDLGHKNIYKSPDLPNIIRSFISKINPDLV